jgi:glycosyltransferase involved in cell wall biosynthesis
MCEGKKVARKIFVHAGPNISAKGGIASVLMGYDKSRSIFEEKGYELRFLSTTGNSLLDSLVTYCFALVKIFILCVIRKIHLVHIHTSVNGSLLRKLIIGFSCTVAGGRYVVHVHSGRFVQYFDELSGLSKKIVILFFRSAKFVICLSDKTKAELIVRGLVLQDRCGVIANGFEDPVNAVRDIAMSTSNRKITVAYLGKLVEAKGIFVLLDAFKQMSHQHMFCRLVIAGDSGDEKFAQAISSQELAEFVDFVGWIDGEKKKNLMREMDIFVLPSRSEGFSVAIVEAMAWGAAVVSTRIPGVVDAVQDGVSALLVEPDDPVALRFALERLIKDGGMRVEMGRAARNRFVENYTMDKIIGKIIGVYNNII